eukprot:scaffold1207_cov170-Alexandrium_tamarense.AAC.9
MLLGGGVRRGVLGGWWMPSAEPLVGSLFSEARAPWFEKCTTSSLCSSAVNLIETATQANTFVNSLPSIHPHT